MNQENLLFYNEYETFYTMADKNEVFKEYCQKVYGIDFSQDGFNDLDQINDLLRHTILDKNSTVLDIGCGNGKMLKYIQEKTDASIYGFDFSNKAIETAQKICGNKSNFQVGAIGEIEYRQDMFDLITAMDSIHFAKDMNKLVIQIYGWLKPDGSFICSYQEREKTKKTLDTDTTELAKAFRYNDLAYTVIDYTNQMYELLKRQKEVLLSMKEKFFANNMKTWYENAMKTSESANILYEEFRKENARYHYIVKK